MGLSHYNLKVYCDGLAVEYPVFYSNGKRGVKEYDRKNRITDVGYTMNRPAKRKIKNVLIYRFYKSKKNKYDRLKFFTFTIQQSHYNTFDTPKEADTYYIKKLSMCLENLTKNYDCRGYVWVAEKTQNGVIHFHAILDAGHISALRLSTYWANLCGFEDTRNSVHFGFESKNGHKKTKIRSAKQLSRYLTEYVTKNESIIYGRAYGMNGFFSNTYDKACKTYEGGSFRGTSTRQYDVLQLAKQLNPVTILDDGISPPIQVHLSIMEFDVCAQYFFPEIFDSDYGEFDRDIKKQQNIELVYS